MFLLWNLNNSQIIIEYARSGVGIDGKKGKSQFLLHLDLLLATQPSSI
jgi:hypothetical protein